MDLLKYITDIECLEKEKYLLECTIRKIDSEINELGKEITVYHKTNPIPEDETEPSFAQSFLLLIALGWGALGLYSLSIAPKFIVFYIFFFFLPCVLIIYGIIRSVQKMRSDYNYNEYVIKENYKNDIKQAEEKMKNRKQMSVYYKNAREKLYNTYTQTCGLLERLYSKDIIYGKYRYDLVAICMFAEYFKSHRCSSFEGHEGAYNIYESEIRLGVIISKLDDIISRLDAIERNQYGLYNALKEIGYQQSRILDNLQDISKKQDRQIANAEYIKYDLDVLRRNSDIAMIYGMKYI